MDTGRYPYLRYESEKEKITRNKKKSCRIFRGALRSLMSSVPDPLHFGTDPDPRARTRDFLLITFQRYIYISLQRSKDMKSHKTVEIKVTLIVLLDERRIWIRIRTSD